MRHAATASATRRRSDSPTSGCPAGKDTCPRPGAGSDPQLHGLLDDICYTEFTAGQAERMAEQWLYYRAAAG